MRRGVGLVAMWAFGAVAAGCGDDRVRDAEESGARADAGDSTATPRCGANGWSLSGMRVDEQRGCLAESVPLSCLPRRQGCASAIAVARDPHGGLWWFSSLCIPEGFEIVPDAPSLHWPLCNPPPREPFEGCDGLSESICAKEPDCALIQGMQYDAARSCRAERVSTIGCRQKREDCTDAHAHVRFFDMTFQVSNGCIPSKSVSIPAPSGLGAVEDWPVCSSFP